MRKLAAEAVEVGALGFASSRLTLHKTESGHPIPSFEAGHAEIEAIARGVKDAGGGLIQFVPDLVAGDYGPALQTVFDVAEDVGPAGDVHARDRQRGRPVLRRRTEHGREGQRREAATSRAQVFPRPIGLVIGLELSGNPFVLYPSYRAIAHLPLAERVAEMRKPEVRERILADTPASDGHPLMFAPRRATGCSRWATRRTTSPPRSESIAAGPGHVASARSRRPTTACSTTTGTPCCSSRWPTSATARWTPWPSCCAATTSCSASATAARTTE